MLCGLGLSWCDLWRGIGNGAQWNLAINSIGLCIFPMVAFRLDWGILMPRSKPEAPYQKRMKAVLYIWIIAFIVFAYPAFKHFAPGTDYDARVAVAVVNVGLYGLAALRLYYHLFYEKRSSGRGSDNMRVTWVFFPWLIFMTLAIASVNKSLWPFWFLMMFGSFYLAPITPEEMEEIIDGLSTGIIAGFFLIQGRAFLYRPFDGDTRYYGHFTNPNVNAMFYLFSYIAWMVKLTVCRLHNKRFWYGFTLFMASAMWIFAFLTGSRSSWMGFFGVTVLYWIAESSIRDRGKKAGFVLSRIALIALLAVVSFLPVWVCVRYIPPLRHHPVWYQSEYNESRIMAWDPIDSPKYAKIDRVIATNFSRFDIFAWDRARQKELEEESDSDKSATEAILGYQTVDADSDMIAENDTAIAEEETVIAEAESFYPKDPERVLRYADGKVPGSDGSHPVFIESGENTSFLRKALGIRYYIFKYDLSMVRLMGNESFETAFVLSYWNLVHTHNSMLQIAYWFGGIAGIIFAGLLVYIPIRGIAMIITKKNLSEGGKSLLFDEFAIITLAGYALIGLFECVAFPGEMGLTLYFMALLPAIRRVRNL